MQQAVPALAIGDAHFALMACNDQAAALLSHPDAKGALRQGASILDLLPEEDRAALRSALENAESDLARDVRHTVVNRDGRLLDVDTTIGSAAAKGDGRLVVAIARDVTARRQNEIRLLESEEKYRALIGTAQDAIFIADVETGRILEASAGAEELLGIPVRDLVGMHHTKLHPRDDSDLYASVFAEHARAGGRWQGGLFAEHRDGRQIPVEIAATVFQIGGRQMVLGIFRDVAERQRAEAEAARQTAALLRANEQLERLHQAKDEFVATISHELRTPLVTGLGYIELLLEGRLGPVPEAAEGKMRVAYRNLKSLAGLIDLTFSYHELIREDFRQSTSPTAFALVPFLEECVEDFLVRSGRARGDVDVRSEESMPRALADLEMIRRVLANLLDNAGRHGGDGAHVVVSARTLPSGRLEISVADDGPGMEAPIAGKAFEPFARGQERTRPSEPGVGLGLGLSIVQAILASHDSAVTLDTAPGQGTTVTFDLAPAEPAAP